MKKKKNRKLSKKSLYTKGHKKVPEYVVTGEKKVQIVRHPKQFTETYLMFVKAGPDLY